MMVKRKGMRPAFNTTKILLFSCILIGILILVAPLSQAFAANSKITVMTRNLYLGADIFRVVEAAQTNPASIPFVVAEVYQTMLYTNFWARAEAIADEIAKAKPDVIGLQEVSTFYIQTPGDFMIGNPEPANTVVIDFYQVLDNALKARKMYYQAFEVTNTDVELPMIDLNSPTYLLDVRLVDHDYVLVRKGNPAALVLAHNYDVKLEMDIGGVPVAFDRGFVIVDVVIKGDAYRFVSTHLEVAGQEGSVFRLVQSYQMMELLLTLDYFSSLSPKPLIMVGDFNSSPTDAPGYYESMPYIPPYLLATDPSYMLGFFPGAYSGRYYLDTWLEQKRYGDGFTSGFDEWVSDPEAVLSSRIDLIFLDPHDLVLDKVACEVVGDEVRDMVPNPDDPRSYLWPSDHAGVIGDIKLKFPKKAKK